MFYFSNYTLSFTEIVSIFLSTCLSFSSLLIFSDLVLLLIILALIGKRAPSNIVDPKFYQVYKNSAKFRDRHYPQVPSTNADIKYGLNDFLKSGIS